MPAPKLDLLEIRPPSRGLELMFDSGPWAVYLTNQWPGISTSSPSIRFLPFADRKRRIRLEMELRYLSGSLESQSIHEPLLSLAI